MVHAAWTQSYVIVASDHSMYFHEGGAHHQGRGGHYNQAGRTRPWQAGVRPPARFSNAGLAIIICIPLVFTGVLLGQ